MARTADSGSATETTLELKAGGRCAGGGGKGRLGEQKTTVLQATQAALACVAAWRGAAEPPPCPAPPEGKPDAQHVAVMHRGHEHLPLRTGGEGPGRGEAASARGGGTGAWRAAATARTSRPGIVASGRSGRLRNGGAAHERLAPPCVRCPAGQRPVAPRAPSSGARLRVAAPGWQAPWPRA